jgi:phage terminase small subunit
MTRQLKARMTPKQRRFVSEYLVDLNATQAAVRAGYAEKGAGQKGWQLLRWRPAIAAAVREAMHARENRTLITSDRVVQQYGRIAFADIRQMMRDGANGLEMKKLHELTEDQAAAIAELSTDGKTIRLKLNDRMAALNALARHVAIYEPRREEDAPHYRGESRMPAREILRRKLAQLAGEKEGE